MAGSTQTAAVRFAPRRLGHTNLFVGELDRSMRFFNSVCGLKEARREVGISAGFLSNGNSDHDIGMVQAGGGVRIGVGGHVQIPQGRGNQPGLNHLGWEMDSEQALVAAWRRAGEAGVDIHRTADHQHSHSVYVFDPDGNLHEFYADVLDEWVMKPDEQGRLTGQWTPASSVPSATRHWISDPEFAVVPGAVFHPRRMARAAFVAKDLPRLKAFFMDVAGLDEVCSTDDFALLRSAAAVNTWDLALFAPGEHRTPGLHHSVFEVADEAGLTEGERRARAAGVAIELIVDRADKRSVFTRDPDGTLFEFRCAREGSPDFGEGSPAMLRPYFV